MDTKKEFFMQTSNLTGTDLKIFSEWLDSYFAEQEINAALEELSEVWEDDTVVDAARLQEIADSFDRTAVQPAQIRLLRKNCAVDQENMAFILVLSQWGDNSWLLAPFSRFDTPATEGEMCTDMDENNYRVLQCWNAFVLQEEILMENTYFIKSVSEEIRLKSSQLYFHLLEGENSAGVDNIVTGPMIMSEIDPRIQYLQEESFLYSRIRTMKSMKNSDSFQDKVKWIMENVSPVFPVREGALAAGEEEKDLVCECTVNGFADLITVEYEVKAKTLRIVCFTPDDEYSYLFDQWQIVDRKGEIIGTISGERAVIENMTEFDGMICLCDTSGELHTLQNRGE